MAEIININSLIDERGELGVLDEIDLPFDIKRVYYIYNVDNSERAKHRHKITRQLLICVSGTCDLYVNNGNKEFNYSLTKPNYGLILEPENWHIVKNFLKEAH